MEITAIDPPSSYLDGDTDLARRFRAARTWVRDQSEMVPLPLGEPNTIDTPYPVPTKTYGWAAGDAAYAMGTYSWKTGRPWSSGDAPPSARSGTCASGTASSTRTTTTTSG